MWLWLTRPERAVMHACWKRFSKLHPKRSCMFPVTLRHSHRDLAVLAAGGYHVREVQPVDQFPHTNHIENVCLLTRKREI